MLVWTEWCFQKQNHTIMLGQNLETLIIDVSCQYTIHKKYFPLHIASTCIKMQYELESLKVLHQTIKSRMKTNLTAPCSHRHPLRLKINQKQKYNAQLCVNQRNTQLIQLGRPWPDHSSVILWLLEPRIYLGLGQLKNYFDRYSCLVLKQITLTSMFLSVC